MNSRKSRMVILGLVLSVSLISSALAVWLTSRRMERSRFEMLNAVCAELLAQKPEVKGTVASALKAYADRAALLSTGTAGAQPDLPVRTDVSEAAYAGTEKDLLSELGYRSSDFSALTDKQCVIFATAGFLAGALLFFAVFWCRNRLADCRIRALTEYLELVNEGKAAVLSPSGEDEYSRLEDEIYKTVTSLRHVKDQAVRVKNGFAENLSNIAHQLKTPITAISLDVQMLETDLGKAWQKYDGTESERKSDGTGQDREPDRNQQKDDSGSTWLAQIRRQLLRLSYLEKSLLTLSRLDAGTLVFRRKETDVFTLLVLAADHLQELCIANDVSIDIPDSGEISIAVDPDWTMEAISNLMKNCIEHHRGGTVHCSFAQNPLYTEILIWDEGEGFVQEDIPHLFERFYRGKNAAPKGIGIGLALAKEMIERQNGTVRAQNRREGGACYEIRLYAS